MKATIAGLGANEALAGGGEGTVLASFREAVYVSLPGGIVVLVAPGVHPGPLYMVLDRPPTEVPPGAPVHAANGSFRVGGIDVDFRDAALWAGTLPSRARLASGATLLLEVASDLASRSALHTDPFRGRAAQARTRLRAGDLAGTVERLAGLGPGLTPAGDDALAGALFVLRILGGDEAERALVDAACKARTSAIASAFLSWAARGQALAPGHDLLKSAAYEDRHACVTACQALARIGTTSGADFALGLTWALAAR
ncbi:MAG: DUF2877 domain-containing protein [Actinomycetota bacterium]